MQLSLSYFHLCFIPPIACSKTKKIHNPKIPTDSVCKSARFFFTWTVCWQSLMIRWTPGLCINISMNKNWFIIQAWLVIYGERSCWGITRALHTIQGIQQPHYHLLHTTYFATLRVIRADRTIIYCHCEIQLSFIRHLWDIFEQSHTRDFLWE